MIIIFKFISKILSDTLYIAEFWLLHTQPIDPLNICSFSFNLYYSFTPLQKIKKSKIGKKKHMVTLRKDLYKLSWAGITRFNIYISSKKNICHVFIIFIEEKSLYYHMSLFVSVIFFLKLCSWEIYIFFYFILYNI